MADVEVVGYSWPRFREWFAKAWKPGQHVALIGPTGTGKSTLAVAVLPLRKYVLAVDPKGGDTTLRTLSRQGFVRIDTWPPPRRIRKQIDDGRPARLIVGGVVNTRADLPRLRSTVAAALGDAFDEGGWTVYVDELQIAADRRMMGLSGSIEQLLIAARDKGVSVVSSYQRPANVPRSASEMSRYIAVWYTRDTDTVGRLGEMVGMPKAEVRGAVRALRGVEHAVLVWSNNPNDPIVVTRAPRAA